MSNSSTPNSLTPWQMGRLGLLAIIFVGAIGAIGKTLLSPPPKPATKPSEVTYTFPKTVPLQGWQLVNSNGLEVKDAVAGQRYQYNKDGASLEVEIQYMAPSSDGNITRFLFVYSPLRSVNSQLQERFQPQMGYYGVLTYEGKAYLTFCTALQGQSTITEQQFSQNRTFYDFRPDRVLGWLVSLGGQKLSDRRCLWTLMSTPIQSTSAPGQETSQSIEAAYRLLESAWMPWHTWWQQNFPKQ